MYLIRIFNELFNMDPDYYYGDTDIQKEVICSDKNDLFAKWEKLLKDYEGQTYAVLDLTCGSTDPEEMAIVAGAFDPMDFQFFDDVPETEYN